MSSGAGGSPLALQDKGKKSSDDRPSCLENPRPAGAESTLTENVASPFQAEPAHDGLRVAYFSAEFGLTECLSIFAGGLGILAGDQLLAWHAVTPYKKPSDYVWATDANRAGVKRGKQPVWLSTVMRDYIQPMARKLGIQKKVSWHTFRHTFSSILKRNGEDVKVVQELLRHSTSRMTLDTYTQALGPDKRAAQSKVVGMIRPKERVFSVYRDADGVYV